MLNLLTIDGTILDKRGLSETDITLKGPMFSINQTLFIKGLFHFFAFPHIDLAPNNGKFGKTDSQAISEIGANLSA